MINTLPEFESRQVLTSDELNWLTCYLDSQNRQSRRFLLGCGLIGGLQVRLVSDVIHISNGFGLTSAGHIVSLQKDHADFTIFTKARKYVQKSKEKFAFHYLSDMDPAEEDYSKSATLPSLYFACFQHDVLELCEDTVNDADLLIGNSLQGKVVMLFAEIIQLELKDCADDNCQERGKKYLYNTRPLVISKEDALHLLNNEYSVQTTDETAISKLAFPWMHLPNMNLLKPAFSAVQVNDVFDEAIIQNEYQRCISDFVAQFSLLKFQVDESLTNLRNYCTSWKSGFAIADQLLKVLQSNAADGKSVVAYQVMYDFLWCFVKAYQEIQLECQGLRAKCSTIESAFPNHVLLGIIGTQDAPFNAATTKTHNIYRHAFQSRFIQSDQTRISRSVSILISRLRLLVDHFDSAVIGSMKEIKVTPGGSIFKCLSNQTIPHYLKPAIANTWSQSRSSEQHLGSYITSYSSVNESQQPSISLSYNSLPSSFQSDHSFYRIEGVHGQPALSSLNTLFQIRRKHGLPFEILMLRLNEKAPFSHAFNFTVNEDIESMYQVIRAELIKQISLNTAYLWSLRIKDGKFETMKTALIRAMERSLRMYLQVLNSKLLTPIAISHDDAVIASNIAIGHSAKTEMVELRFKELEFQVAEEKPQDMKFIKSSYNKPAAVNIEAMKGKTFGPEIFGMEIGVFFFNNLGNLVDSIKTNDKFKKTSDVSFYTHLLAVAKSMLKSDKQNDLFLLALQLYCALKLQEEYLSENFLELDIKNYKENLTDHLVQDSATIMEHLKALNVEKILNDEVLEEVDRKEILSYAERIRFDDDWVKIIQVDTENKKRNGGLGVENLLGRFIKIHPGLSHGYGVPKGGTYIMVYDQNNVIAADFYIPYIISSHLRPIQYTLLENKTLTLSGTVKDETGKLVTTTLLVNKATIVTDNTGFYNALVSENTPAKVICNTAGFHPFDKDVAIKDKSMILDIVLKKADLNKTTTLRFKNQLDKIIDDDIILFNEDKKTEENAKGGVLQIKDLTGSSHSFTVKDNRFEERQFKIVIGSNDKEEEVKLKEVDVVRVRIIDLVEDYKGIFLESIRILDSKIKFDTSNLMEGIFETIGKFDISKPVTVEVVYNKQKKQESVQPGKDQEIIFNNKVPVDTSKVNVFVKIFYPKTEIRDAVTKLKSVLINKVPIKIDEKTGFGIEVVPTEGTIIIDKRWMNIPEVKIEKLSEISNVVIVLDAALISEGADDTSKSLLTFSKILSQDEAIALTKQVRSDFVFIEEHISLTDMHFFCLVLNPDEMKLVKKLKIDSTRNP